MLGEKIHHTYKPDAQAFDEVRIITVPRYKESSLSGDVWRISAAIQFYRNGELQYEVHAARNVEKACAFAAFYHARAVDEGHACFGGEGHYCDQEGCHEQATHFFRLKKGYSRDGSERRLFSTGEYRQFCDRHRVRGDWDWKTRTIITNLSKTHPPDEPG